MALEAVELSMSLLKSMRSQEVEVSSLHLDCENPSGFRVVRQRGNNICTRNGVWLLLRYFKVFKVLSFL